MFRLALATSSLMALVIGGCSFSADKEMANVSSLAHYATSYDHSIGGENGFIERTLQECSEKTVKAESVCMKDALNSAHLSAKVFSAKFPSCSIGKICHYDYTTNDNLGFVEASATEFIVRWRVEADFRNNASDAANVPVNIKNRDDFGDPTKEAAKKEESQFHTFRYYPKNRSTI